MKLYESKDWLKWALYKKKMKPSEIAEFLGVHQATIYRKMKEFGLK